MIRTWLIHSLLDLMVTNISSSVINSFTTSSVDLAVGTHYSKIMMTKTSYENIKFVVLIDCTIGQVIGDVVNVTYSDRVLETDTGYISLGTGIATTALLVSAIRENKIMLIK